MRSLAIVAVDTALILLASALAVHFAVPEFLSAALEKPLLLYIGVSCAVTALFFVQAGTGRELRDFSSPGTYRQLVSLVALGPVFTLIMGRMLDFFAEVPLALPFLQIILAITLLIGCREASQGVGRMRRALLAPPRATPVIRNAQGTLIIGVNGLADVLLRLVGTYALGHFDIVGLVSTRFEDIGRSAYGLRILADTHGVGSKMRDLRAHGIDIRNIIVAVPDASLPLPLIALLRRLHASGEVNILEFRDVLALISPNESDSLALIDAAPEASPVPVIALREQTLAAIATRPYWAFKRMFDIVAALIGLVLAAPLFLICAALVVMDVGAPVIFWQRRPGLGGKPFNVLKFRTMRSETDASGFLIADHQRTSRIGAFIRRTRLDELPQLINILRGDMSLIGPRPLLPHDQSEAFAARLIVRPGLTGWAQVVGGRVIDADEKAALDIWYVYHAGFWLDFRILLRTVPMILRGEKVDRAKIAMSLREVHHLVA